MIIIVLFSEGEGEKGILIAHRGGKEWVKVLLQVPSCLRVLLGGAVKDEALLCEARTG